MATNTLIITGFERQDFLPQEPESVSVVSKLQSLIQRNVPIVHWAPLTSFGRVLSVFESAHDAVIARQVIFSSADSIFILTSSDNEKSPSFKKHDPIKAYFYNHTPLYNSTGEEITEENSDNTKLHSSKTIVTEQYLHPPEAPHLFFISPPPSPPADWVSREEDPPRIGTPLPGIDSAIPAVPDYEQTDVDSDPFHSTLQAALKNLEFERLKSERRQHDATLLETHAGKQRQLMDGNDDNVSINNATTTRNPRGKLTKRMTLHESTPSPASLSKSSTLELPQEPQPSSSNENSKPVLSLNTDNSSSTSSVNSSKTESLMTPTIVLEWEEDEDMKDIRSNPLSAIGHLPMSGGLKNLRTERPPLPV